MIVKTEAVVLKSMRFRDSSKIVTFYSRRFGKIKGIAKGARDTKSKFGGALEPLTLVSLVLYKKEYRDLQLISQCDILRVLKNVHSELERMYVGLSIVELVDQLTHEEEGNDQLFALMRDSLEALEEVESNFSNLLYAFELRFASLFGYAPSFTHCVQCQQPLDWEQDRPYFVFETARGGFFCGKCDEPASSHNLSARSRLLEPRSRSTLAPLRLSLPTARILKQLSSAPLTSVARLDFRTKVRNEINETLRLYLRCHFEEFRSLKSSQVLHDMLS